MGAALAATLLLLAGTASAYDPYLDPYRQNQARQQREFQVRTQHYASIAAADSAARRGSSRRDPPPLEWKSNAQKLREWEATLARIKADSQARDAADRAWDAHVEAYHRRIRAENAIIERENAEIRRLNELGRQESYETLKKDTGGMGTKVRPPGFATEEQAVRWYLNQANAGDPYGAFYVGRAK